METLVNLSGRTVIWNKILARINNSKYCDKCEESIRNFDKYAAIEENTILGGRLFRAKHIDYIHYIDDNLYAVSISDYIDKVCKEYFVQCSTCLFKIVKTVEDSLGEQKFRGTCGCEAYRK
jgi:hypothetical protein